MYYEVLIESPFLYNDTLTYSYALDLEVGVRVKVPLNNRSVVGFIMAKNDRYEGNYEVLDIIEPIDEYPLLSDELWQLGHHMSYITVSPLIRCFQTMLPNSLKPKSSSKKVKKIKMVKPTFKPIDSLTKRQVEVVEMFKEPILLTSARKTYASFNKLIELGYFSTYEIDDVESLDINDYIGKPLALTSLQRKAYESIDLNNYATYLLHGITGSGKTEVYLHLCQDVLNENKSVFVLVPEIGLTPQLIQRFKSRFGKRVIVYHSGITDKQRHQAYIQAKNNEGCIIIGTRSSIFLPNDKIGLIILDEEHDSSYKQESTPYYHTKDMAIFRAKYHNIPLVLGSASPSLESYSRALFGDYKLVEMGQRINESLPLVHLVDMQKRMSSGKYGIISTFLDKAIITTLEKKEQVIILLNRRGYHPVIKDMKTQTIKQCPHCDVNIAYHKETNELRCHQCGYTEKASSSDIQGGSGIGTQKLVELLQSKYPYANIERLDADSTRTKNSFETIMNSFGKGEIDILVGTQMIAKGHDFENVTLVGIINGDNSLTYTDYRSVENTFDTLMQASGRSGRGKKQGHVVIQTYHPDHYAVKYAVMQKYKHFYQEEMKYRKIAKYPPYSYLISIIFNDLDENTSYRKASSFINSYNKGEESLIGPVSIRKLSRFHRVRILLKGRDLEDMLKRVHEAVTLYYKIEKGGIVVDVNPLSIE